nr:hypothetical protein Iba_chr14aCG5100 [Ipomoea batatas]
MGVLLHWHEKLASLTLLRDFILHHLATNAVEGRVLGLESGFEELQPGVAFHSVFPRNPSRKQPAVRCKTSHGHRGIPAPPPAHRNLRHASPRSPLHFHAGSKQKDDQPIDFHGCGIMFVVLKTLVDSCAARTQLVPGQDQAPEPEKVPDLRHQHVSQSRASVQIRATDYHSSGNPLVQCQPERVLEEDRMYEGFSGIGLQAITGVLGKFPNNHHFHKNLSPFGASLQGCAKFLNLIVSRDSNAEDSEKFAKQPVHE